MYATIITESYSAFDDCLYMINKQEGQSSFLGWLQYILCMTMICHYAHTVGEPLTMEMQKWCYKVVGRENCLILDTWWQTGSYIIAVVYNHCNIYKASCMFNFFSFTETGSIALTHWFAPEGKKPSHFPSKSSFSFFGVELVLVCNWLNHKPSSYIDDLI